MSGASSRRKGHDFERRVARGMRAIFPKAARGYQTRGGTKEAPDVDGTPFYIECKKGKKTNWRAAFAQATRATDGRPPVAICQDDHCAAVVIMDYEDWRELVVVAQRGQKK